jgi:type VI secretion system protein ImpC
MSSPTGFGKQSPRSPRVEITYDIEVGDTVEKVEIPFVVGVLADLGGKADEPTQRLRERRFRDIDLNNFDHILARIEPGLRFAVKAVGKGETDGVKLPVELKFKCLADFGPGAVVAQVPVLAALLKLREDLVNLRSNLFGNDRLEELLFEHASRPELLEGIRGELTAGAESPQPGLLYRIMSEGFPGATGEEQLFAREAVDAFFREVLSGGTIVSRDVDTVLAARIAALDSLLSSQVDEILHAPEFQKLEASWRGLYYLVSQTDPSSTVKIKVLNVSKKELWKDLSRAPEFDQTAIFKKVHEEEYATLGGQPFAVLIGDYEWSRLPGDIEALEHISHVAAATHAPFISAVSPEMFNLADFTELGLPRDLSKIFDNNIYTKWKRFRESEEARYVGLVLPRILLRLPYGAETVPVETFPYQESVTEGNHDRYLWGNAAYAFAVRLTSAFQRYGWCAEIRGVEKGGVVRGLPLHRTQADAGETIQCPTEIPITDRRQDELCRLGFIALCYSKNSDYAAFLEAPSCHKPRGYLGYDAQSTALASSQLEYVLVSCRFAHYIKAIIRSKGHVFKSRQEYEDYVKNWISGYVRQADSTGEDPAKRPLAAATVEVVEIPGKPGAYTATAFVKPLFQLDEMPLSMRTKVKVEQLSRWS